MICWICINIWSSPNVAFCPKAALISEILYLLKNCSIGMRISNSFENVQLLLEHFWMWIEDVFIQDQLWSALFSNTYHVQQSKPPQAALSDTQSYLIHQGAGRRCSLVCKTQSRPSSWCLFSSGRTAWKRPEHAEQVGHTVASLTLPRVYTRTVHTFLFSHV